MEAVFGLTVELVDTHCHVDLFPSPATIVLEAETAKVHVIAVTNAPSVFFHSRNLCEGSAFVHAAVGLHPELVHSHEGELAKMWTYLDETRFVGEVGLDYVTTDLDLRRRQREVFSAIVAQCSERGGKVLTIHSRRAASDVLSVLSTGFQGSAILHWFSGTRRELERGLDAGCYFSVNPQMVLSKSGQSLIAAMPRDRVLTETDSPFVSAPKRPVGPHGVIDAVRGLAKLWHVGQEEAAAVVLSNYLKLTASA